MAKILNVYGDSAIETTGKHGADISSQRIDDLDAEALIYAIQIKDTHAAAVDLGCGKGVQGLRFASLGLATTLIDWLPEEATIMNIGGIDKFFPLVYIRKDARLLVSTDFPSNTSICYSQRFIHYMRFLEATSLLKRIRERMVEGGRLFLSASGLRSELGTDYDGDSDLANRFSILSPTMAEKHGIYEPVCLYTPDELVALCKLASFAMQKVYSSPFGNVKGIFVAA